MERGLQGGEDGLSAECGAGIALSLLAPRPDDMQRQVQTPVCAAAAQSSPPRQDPPRESICADSGGEEEEKAGRGTEEEEEANDDAVDEWQFSNEAILKARQSLIKRGVLDQVRMHAQPTIACPSSYQIRL